MDEPSRFLVALRATAQPVALPAGAFARPTARSARQDPVNAVVAWTDVKGHAPHRFDVGLKDIFALPGHAPGGGTALGICRPEKQGGVIRRLLAAGGRVVALLNQDELAAGGSGQNRRHGRCRNPWNPDHLTGGSSSGSAAAVAAGVVPMSLGSDAGGSIRIPAAWCGVTGHKPTYGLVGRSGALARGWSVDCIGPLAKDARSCAALLAVIAGPDSDDPMTWQAPPLEGVFPGKPTIRMPHLPPGLCCAETIAARDAAAAAFTQAGYLIAQGPAPDFDALNEAHQALVRAEAASLHAEIIDATPEGCDQGVAALIRSGRAIPATAYIAAAAGRASALREVLGEVLGPAELVLLPVTPTPAPPARASHEHAARMSDDAVLTRWANYLGLPATAFPAGHGADGLPIGLQLVGRPFADGLCLSAVADFQRVTGHHLARAALHCSD